MILEDIHNIFLEKVQNIKDKTNDALRDDKQVFALFDKWLDGYTHENPSDFFLDHPTNDPLLVSNI
jgi:hypothetical protein